MTFLFPSFLWALLALAVPVIIHLFQLRRFKRIDFPNVQFLAEATRQTRQRRKVQHWLVLLARCGALAALVMAFAQPYLPAPGNAMQAGQRAVSIYLDNSYSMDGVNAGGRLLDQARAGARDAIMTYAPTDRYQVVTTRLEGREQLLIGRDEALLAAAQVDATPYSRPLSQVMARQREAVMRSDAPLKRAILFTDLQRSTTDVERWSADSTMSVVLIPFQSDAVDNLAIDSAWFASPVRRIGAAEQLHVRIRNYGNTDLSSIPLRLDVDGVQRALATFSVQAGAMVDTTLRFTNDKAGWHRGKVSIMDRPVTFDDHLHIAYRTAAQLNVVLVSGGVAESDARIAAVFKTDSTYRLDVQPVRSADLAAIASSDLIILNGLAEIPGGMSSTLREAVEQGASLAIFPAQDIDRANYSALCASLGAGSYGKRDTATMNVDRIDLEHPFFKEVFSTMPRNVDLPRVRLRHLTRPSPGSDVLLRLQDGGTFLSSTASGEGQVYLCASPLTDEGGSFTRHALFVTTLLRMAATSRPMGALYHTLGDGLPIPLIGAAPAGDQALHLKGPEGYDLVPEIRKTPGGTMLILHDTDLPAGAYAVVNPSDTLQLIALDLARGESDLSAYDPDDLRAEIEQRGLRHVQVLDHAGSDLSISLKELDEGRKLWKWFVLLALAFLAAEVVLIRSKK